MLVVNRSLDVLKRLGCKCLNLMSFFIWGFGQIYNANLKLGFRLFFLFFENNVFAFNLIPFMPLDDLTLNNLNFLDLNLMHLPNCVLNNIS